MTQNEKDLILDLRSWIRKEDCAEDLDDIIHDICSRHATEINNLGVEGQLKWMRAHQYSPLEIKSCFKEIRGE